MLNQQQSAAVHYLQGPLLVLAGAGSGKTRVITEKIMYLIRECGYSPKHITAVTFTNHAAQEMKSRIKALLSVQERRGLSVSTFHTLGLKIIKESPERFHLASGFSIFDTEDALQVIRQLLGDDQAYAKEHLLRIQTLISLWKNAGGPINDHDRQAQDPLYQQALVMYERYQMALRAYNAVDFDDLIALPVKIFSADLAYLSHWQSKIHYLLVDEYQDSNHCQYQLVYLLMRHRPAFTVVGDDDQSIYAWRGARPEHLKTLAEDFPQLKIIKLEQNYRSSGHILKAANQLISHNPHVFSKVLWSTFGMGALIRVMHCQDEQDEAEQVVLDLLSRHYRTKVGWDDCAILYRGNHQCRPFEHLLRKHGIPYQIRGGPSWFSRTEIKDCLAYLRLLCNPLDDAAFLRIINIPKRGIGETSLMILGEYAKKRQLSLYQVCDHFGVMAVLPAVAKEALGHFKVWMEAFKHQLKEQPIELALKQMIEALRYEAYLYEQADTPIQAEKKMENVWALITWISSLFEKPELNDLADVIARLTLIDRLDRSDEVGEGVQLLTLHASKGLEFDYVYLVGMEESLLPHRTSIEENTIEEERRLAYVGITRAKKELALTLAMKRKRGGELLTVEPSRFLAELPQDVLQHLGQTRTQTIGADYLQGLRALLHH